MQVSKREEKRYNITIECSETELLAMRYIVMVAENRLNQLKDDHGILGIRDFDGKRQEVLNYLKLLFSPQGGNTENGHQETEGD